MRGHDERRRLLLGNNASGQLGDGTGNTRLVPTQVVGNIPFTSIRSSRVNSIFNTTCGVTPSGDAYCWGYGSKGQLGTAPATDACTPFSPPGVINNNPVTFVCSYRPAKVAGVSNIVAIDVGLEHVCTITATPRWSAGATECTGSWETETASPRRRRSR